MEVHVTTETREELALNHPATARKKVHLNLIEDLTQLLGVKHQLGLSDEAEVDTLSFGVNQPKCTGCGACRCKSKE
jgi:hypothetical protein